MAITFAKLTQKLPCQNAMLVDSMNLAFRWKHSKAKVFAQDFLSTVQSLARSYESGTILILADKKGSKYRKSVFPQYKANRAQLYKDQTQKQKKQMQDFFNQYQRSLQVMQAAGFPILRYQGVQADDLAAYIVKKRKWYGYQNIWMISSDRDWDLLVSQNVSRFSYVTRKQQTIHTWDNPVPPQDYISYKCLIGDKGDNIPGIAGIGPVKATQLIQQYGSAMDIYCNCPIDSKYKYIQTLNQNCQQLLINYKLMDLLTYCQQAIGQDNILDIGRKLVHG